ncbi:NADPH quinone reductase [Lecanora helva]
MQALQISKEGDAHKLRVATVDKPVLKPGYVLVKVYASADNPNDLLDAQGNHPTGVYPHIPGRDFAGIVEAGPAHLIGLDVYGTSGHDFKFTENGSHAEYCLVKEFNILLKPNYLTFPQAASIGVPYAAAEMALERVQANSRDTVMVLGATGMVGWALVQLAKSRRGCKVTRVGYGGDVDINSIDDPELSKANSLDNGKGPAVVIDTIGDAKLAQRAMESLAPCGRYALVSVPRGPPSRFFEVDWLRVYRQDVSLFGCNTLNCSEEDVVKKLRDIWNSIRTRDLVPFPNESLTLIGLSAAVDVYKTKHKKHVIVFD